MKLRHFLTILLMHSLILSCIFSRGLSEEEKRKGEIRIYLLFARNDNTANAFMERYHLPSALYSFTWSEFSVEGEEVNLDSRGGYRIVSKKLVYTESIGSYMLYGYDVGASCHVLKEISPLKTYTVTFNYIDMTEKEGFTYQPADWARLKAIWKSKKVSGSVRIVELIYIGAGEFKARVEIG